MYLCDILKKKCFLLSLQLWQLETLLLQKDTYVNYSQALSYTSQALSQNLAGLRKRSPIRKISSTLNYYLEDNWKRLWVLAVWIGIMAGLFIWKFIQYRNRYVFDVMGYCVTTAKGAAETLKLNMALILLPVCRNTITWLRNTKAARALPFDDNINFHKVSPRIKLVLSCPFKMFKMGAEGSWYNFMVYKRLCVCEICYTFSSSLLRFHSASWSFWIHVNAIQENWLNELSFALHGCHM